MMSGSSTPLNPLDTDASSRLLASDEEARLFWDVRRQITWTTLRTLFQTARLRISLVIALSVVFWFAAYGLFLEGFRYIAEYEQATNALFNLFFAALMVMLVFSTAVLLYGSLYRSSEVAFLLTTPTRPARIFIHKFQEAVWFASWGFLLLGTPMLAAFGRAVGAPWLYYVLMLPYMLAFACVPGAVGALLCLVVVHRLPMLRRHVLSVTVTLVVVSTLWLGWSIFTGPESELLTSKWLQNMSARLQFAQQRLLPSWWLSAGLLEAARPDPESADHYPWAQSLLFLALLIANALLFHQLARWAAGRWLQSSYQRLHSEHVVRRRRQLAWIDRTTTWATTILPRQIQLLIVKDLRLFRRDPLQWSQFLIFFSLLVLYFLNIHRFSYDVRITTWINTIGFLNLSVVGLILSTFTTRFVFPMINMEGRRFWILQRLVSRRDTILWSKFLFAFVGSVIPCTTLIVINDLMLPINRPVMAIHLTVCIGMCLGLSGIAVGLGARLLDLRQEAPSKIATGFGGTVNLVISTLFLAAVVACTAIPCHYYVAGKKLRIGWALFDRHMTITGWLVLGTVVAVLLSLIAAVVPMRLGFRAFRRLEF